MRNLKEKIKSWIKEKRIKELKRDTLFDIALRGDYAEHNRQVGRII